MKNIKIYFPYDKKDLKKLILMLLKSKTANEIKKQNYISSYKLKENKIIKEQEKLITIFFEENNESKLNSLIQKNYPKINIIKDESEKQSTQIK